MVKVECESCKAPFQIDERRIPPAGLKMRCPKCGRSFLVASPGAVSPKSPSPATVTRPAVPGAMPRPALAQNPLKQTMVGVGGGADLPSRADPGLPVPVAQPRVPPKPAPPAPPKSNPTPIKANASAPSAAAFGRKTIVGIAPMAVSSTLGVPSRVADPPPAEMPSDFPAALGTLAESDLPVVSGTQQAKRASVASPSAPADPIDDLDFDLPAVPPDLPTAKVGAAGAQARPRAPAKPPPPARPSGPADFDADLPAPAAGLPVRAAAVEASQAAFLSDLPVIAPQNLPARVDASLPSVAASLPTVAERSANLPALAPSLPVVAGNGAGREGANLPSPAASLPVRAEPRPAPAVASSAPARSETRTETRTETRGFGEIELPTVGDSLPPAGTSPAVAGAHAPDSAFGLFGEIDLPHETSPSSSRTRNAASIAPPDSADFGDLELDDRRRSVRPVAATAAAVPTTRSDAPRSAGGMSFGEVDIGGSAADGATIGVDMPAATRAVDAPGRPQQAAASAQARRGAATPKAERAETAARPRSGARVMGGVLLALAVVGGAALQATPYGAFGNLFIRDTIHAGDYRRATAAAIRDADHTSASDTYDAAKDAVEGIYAAQSANGRARALTAYAAFADLSLGARFGADPSRPSRGRQLFASLPTDSPVPYADAALAAQSADNGDVGTARLAIEGAMARAAPTDPIQLDLSLMAGNLALQAKDSAAARAAFTRALALSDDARAHFGLARAYDTVGDGANTKKEVDATLGVSPAHPGALTLRARPRGGIVDPNKALADLAVVLEGPSRGKASPQELSNAYAAKAWVSLERGGATDAREAFARAVAIDPRNVDALNGQGRLFLNEERPAEALARFDTALGIDPSSPETIANDAEAKIALERLGDAKQQLVAARSAFPKSIPILVLLGRVEQHLGNGDAADADLRAAIALVDPLRADAVLPYVALSKLLSERGRLADARATLDEAKAKLAPSPALERALGQICELQGDYDGAIGHFHAAVAKDPKDPISHFTLAVALRKMRKFSDAGVELDKVVAVDKDYPGLSLERGLLFEESGDVEKAIEQFNGALAKAPDDPDLQLHVGAAYVIIGRPDDALPMLHKVLDKRPTSAEAHHYIGRALMLKGGADADAIRYLKRAVELDPNRAEFHVYVAWAANDATPAELELARDEIDQALLLDNVNAEAYWQRGVLERMEGAVEDAIKDENRALALRPSRYEARATLAECFEDKTQDAAALVEWARAVAGDADPPDADPVRHPYWRYRYGKLLMEKGGAAVALAQLLPAATTAEKLTPKPGWLAPLEFLTAEALRKTGKKSDAVEHYKRFLEIAPVNSPDRLDAQQALGALSPR